MSAEIHSNGRIMPKNKIPSESLPELASVPGLFRKIDWYAFGLGTLLVLIGYLLTVAPDVTLEDSGELAVGSMYAGVPHPPGYPVWTLYTWLFTKLLPFSNIAWRVAVASAVAGALACGLIALVVSRGSSMLLESIESFKSLARRDEKSICLVCGLVAALLMGFNGYMWSQSVIVEVYSLSVLSLMGVVCCLMRWVYAPQQRRYLYWAFFLFGICLTNHMSLLVAAVGIQVTIVATQKRLGRDFFLINSIIYVVVLLTRSRDGTSSLDHASLAFLFHSVGVGSVLVCACLIFTTGKIFTEWKSVLFAGIAFGLGAAFYLYMPLASMTNPPMNWGYPRTAEGFVHALKRGQYGSMDPVHLGNVVKSAVTLWNPESRTEAAHFVGQLGLYANGASQEFSPVLLIVAFIPFLFLGKMQDRERAWIIGLAAIWLCLSFLLLLLLNPKLDRQSVELHRVFFTASHVVIAIAIGYGLALLTALLRSQYEKWRFNIIIGSAVGVGLAIYQLTSVITGTFPELSPLAGLARTFQHGENFIAAGGALVLLVVTASFLVLVLIRRQHVSLISICAVWLLFPMHSVISHWQENEQRGHLFGYWFGHDMFSPPFRGSDGVPIYPEMERDAILFGGTDPGRFNPTYMIFCESFAASEHKRNPDFDRRDIYIITQNALADTSYQNYIRAHYNRSTQKDAPFFQNFFNKPGLNLFLPLWKGLDIAFLTMGEGAEKERRVGPSWLVEEDFKDVAGLREKLLMKADPVSKYIYEKLPPDTQSLLLEGNNSALARALSKDLNRILNDGPIYDGERFKGVTLSSHAQRFIQENPKGHTLVRWNRLLLEDAFPEIDKSKGGLYPDLEIRTPSPAESEAAFHEYLVGAERRRQMGQLKPGEDVKIVDGKVQVSGPVAVMEINGLLSRLIFNRNPEHEFYVEESFPLEWMFPHLTPYGTIMKINRQPVNVMTEEMVRKDHEFWRNYSTRLIGDWITYDTPIQEICDFAERLYLRHDYRGFAGDRMFIRDDNAQKAFSKLRSSIGGVYSWRLGYMGFDCPPEIRASKNADEVKRVVREAEFAYKQAFAFCPYSPEAISRFAQFLSNQNRDGDAIRLAKTGLKFDPANEQIAGLLQQLERIKEMRSQPAAVRSMNLQAAFREINRMLQEGKGAEALPLLDQIVSNPAADAEAVLLAVKAFLQVGDLPRLERALIRINQLLPNNPEAWYDLAGIQVTLGKTGEAKESLKRALLLSDERLQKDSTARDLTREADKDRRFEPLRELRSN